MINWLAFALAAVLPWVSGVAWAQNNNMMNGGMGSGAWMGGYGGYWMPVLLVVVVGLVAWIVVQKRK